MTVVVLAAVGVIVVASRSDGRAQELLAEARRFIDRAGSAHFTASVRIEEPDEGGGGRAPETFLTRSQAEGVARFPDRFRLRTRADGQLTDVVGVGRSAFIRVGESETEIASRRWTRIGGTGHPGEGDRGEGDRGEGDRGEGDEVQVDPEGALAGPVRPTVLPRLLTAASAPQVKGERGQVVVVAAGIDAEVAFGPGGQGTDRAAAELSLQESGRPVRLVLDGGHGRRRVRVDYRFTDWGTSDEVRPPAPRELESPPEVDADAIAAYHAVPLLQPAFLPEGWVLERATVVSDADKAPQPGGGEGQPGGGEEAECEQVQIDYGNPAHVDGSFLSLYEMPASCGEQEAPEGAVPFQAGASSGWVDVDPEEDVLARVTVGETAIQAETDLSPDDLSLVLAELVRFDLNAPPGGRPGMAGS